MKFIALLSAISLATVAGSAVSSDGADAEQADRRVGRIKGGNSASSTDLSPIFRRDLKGSKGGYSGGSKGGGDCEKVFVYYDKSDFKDEFQEIGKQAGGANADIDIFMTGPNKGRSIATYTEVQLAYGQKDCYVNGVFTFNRNPKGKPNHQMFTSSTCFAQADAITGGTGAYACAEGTVKRVKRGTRMKQYLEIDVCFTC
jgi:hypothetical protein